MTDDHPASGDSRTGEALLPSTYRLNRRPVRNSAASFMAFLTRQGLVDAPGQVTAAFLRLVGLSKMQIRQHGLTGLLDPSDVLTAALRELCRCDADFAIDIIPLHAVEHTISNIVGRLARDLAEQDAPPDVVNAVPSHDDLQSGSSNAQTRLDLICRLRTHLESRDKRFGVLWQYIDDLDDHEAMAERLDLTVHQYRDLFASFIRAVRAAREDLA